MTTTVPTSSDRAATSRTEPATPDLTGFTLVHRALRSGTRMLAEAVDGIARDEACDRQRQRGITEFAQAVLGEVGAHLVHEDAALWPLTVVSADDWADLAPLTAHHVALERLLARAWSALPVFARCPSSGAPLLAPVLHELADLVEEHLAAEEALVFPLLRTQVSGAALARTTDRLRADTSLGRLLFVVPWVVDQCHPAELAQVLADADPRTRLVLRLGQQRYARRRDAVLG
ncbi:hemerythrin domain-containing protein [Geodermatophilus sp. SYSU D00815]